MQPYPHTYVVNVHGEATGMVLVTASGLPTLLTAPPAEFDGPGDQWSPESLLCAAIADCFVLTFRAVARAAKFEWSDLGCEVKGTLERSNGISQFTHFVTSATLALPDVTDTNIYQANRLLEKAEQVCLIANSLKGERALVVTVVRDTHQC